MSNVQDAEEVAVLNSAKTMMNSSSGLSGSYQLWFNYSWKSSIV